MNTSSRVSYRVDMFTRSGTYVAGDDLTLPDAERLARAEQDRPGRWGKVRIVEVTYRTLRVLRDVDATGQAAPATIPPASPDQPL